MPKVAIITRTKNRPNFLKRAEQSVSGQSLDDYQWVVVNDCGAQEKVDEIVSRSSIKNKRVIHRKESTGMESASNCGIKASDSEYIVIHDDDDSWHSDFLKESIHAIENSIFDVQGSMCAVTAVIETIEADNQIRIRRRYAHNPLKTVDLYTMATCSAVPPPICFLYKRKALETIGFYNEKLPVLGDWEFNLRFLMKYNIQPVYKRFLANYHIRSNANGHLANSLQNQANNHSVYYPFIKNQLLRENLQSGNIGLGYLLTHVAMHEQIRRNTKLMGMLQKCLSPTGNRLIQALHRYLYELNGPK